MLLVGYSDGVVRLSLYRRTDAPVLLNVNGDPEHRRRFDFPPDFTSSLRHCEEVIDQWQDERRAGKRFPYAVRACVTGELLGGVELKPLGNRIANVSYWTSPKHRHHRIATRAVALVCPLAFREHGFHALLILADADNVPSRRVAAANGFREIGLEDGRVRYLLASTEATASERA